MHFSVLCNHKEGQQNTTHEELLLDTSVIVNDTHNMNDATENRNLTAKTGNGNKHQQNREKNSEQEKNKKPNKEQKKGKSVVILGDSKGDVQKDEKCMYEVYVRRFPGAKEQL